MPHIPVFEKEVLEFLDPELGENFIDGTGGSGGHALAISEKNYPGQVLCLDLDKEALERIRQAIKKKDEGLLERVILVNDNFANVEKIVKENNFFPVDGILLDLGMSSEQLEKSGRGFSFLRDEPLDMRFSPEQVLTAREIVNHWPPLELEKILKEYGEERRAKKISQQIIKQRKIKPILTTRELVSAMAAAIPKKFQHGRTHFATRTFQALRIAVNRELENLQRFFSQAANILNHSGRLVIISFHSLEDRIVKNSFRQLAAENKIRILTKKPVRPTRQEIAQNPRSRSARLRAATKI